MLKSCLLLFHNILRNSQKVGSTIRKDDRITINPTIIAVKIMRLRDLLIHRIIDSMYIFIIVKTYIFIKEKILERVVNLSLLYDFIISLLKPLHGRKDWF